MPDFPFDAYWEGSLRRATASQVLGKALGVRGVDELFTIDEDDSLPIHKIGAPGG